MAVQAFSGPLLFYLRMERQSLSSESILYKQKKTYLAFRFTFTAGFDRARPPSLRPLRASVVALHYVILVLHNRGIVQDRRQLMEGVDNGSVDLNHGQALWH